MIRVCNRVSSVMLVLMFVVASTNSATLPDSTHSDSTATQVSDSSWNRQWDEIRSPHPRVESDGVVIGNIKYFIMIHKPDSSIDYKMLRIIPNADDMEGIPKKSFAPPKLYPRHR